MKILNWNIKDKKSELRSQQILILHKRPDVILLQKTRLRTSQIFQLKYYTHHRKDLIDGDIARGGILTAMHSNNTAHMYIFKLNSK